MKHAWKSFKKHLNMLTKAHKIVLLKRYIDIHRKSSWKINLTEHEMSQIDTINIKYGSIKYLLLILMSIGQYVCVCVN